VDGQVWSLIHQTAAAFLYAGGSERAASLMLSAIIGMLSVQSLSMFAFALLRDSRLSAVVTLVILASRATDYGVMYPILPVAAPHSYGAIGLSWAVLVAGLLGCGWRRTGSVLLGLSLAVHASTGVWLCLFLAIATAALVRAARSGFTPIAARWTLLGLAGSALSLALHLIMRPPVAPMPAVELQPYFLAFVSSWDLHRQPLRWQAPGVFFNLCAAAIGVLCLRVGGARFDASDVRLLLAFVVVSAIGSLALASVTLLPLSMLPALLVSAMPARLLNLNAMTFATLLAAVLGSVTIPGAMRAAVLVLSAAALLISGRSAVLFEARQGLRLPDVLDHQGLLLAGVGLLIVGLLIRAIAGGNTGRIDAPVLRKAAVRRDRVTPRTLLSVVLLGGGWWWMCATDAFDPAEMSLKENGDRAVYEAASAEHGVLATGADLWLVQLRTRRPVLLDMGTLDTLPYAISAAPAVDRILRAVYGLSLFERPAGTRPGGRIPLRVYRAAWEGHTTERWQEIRQEYGVTQVVAPADWTLDLPVVATGRELLLYRIPE
jgi:hypothetical protein